MAPCWRPACDRTNPPPQVQKEGVAWLSSRERGTVLGIRFLVQAFLSVMLGGVGTFEGPVLGAAAVGGMAAGLPWVVLPVLADPLVFVIALVVVRMRPKGFITVGRL